MAKPIARYSITTGLSGCYMPDSASGPFICHSRRELADAIRAEIEFQGFPAASFAQAKLRRLWGFIARNGSSVAHFSIEHGAHEIAFHGLTEEEAETMERESEF